MRTFIRPLIPRMEYGLRPSFWRIPYSFFLAGILSLVVANGLHAQRTSVSCFSEINLSINSGGTSRLSPYSLTPMSDLTNIEVSIDGRSDLVITCSDVGTVLMGRVRDTLSGSVCMVRINVEDKAPLGLACTDTSIGCYDGLNTLWIEDLVSVYGSCLPLNALSITFTDSDLIDYSNPTSDTLSFITRNWTATSPDGQIATCESNIYLLRFDLDDVIIPNEVIIECGEDATDTMITGMVEMDLDSLGKYCEVGITSRIIDSLSSNCGTRLEVRREWIITDWSNDDVRLDTQVIVVIDTFKNVLKTPESLTSFQDGCNYKVILDAPEIISNCATLSPSEIEITLDGNTYAIGDTAVVLPGGYDVIYKGIATCENHVIADTLALEIENRIRPILTCPSDEPICLSLGALDSKMVRLDTLLKDLMVETCSPYIVIGRKVNAICDSDGNRFGEEVEFCFDELKESVQLEIRIETPINGRRSRRCFVNIDVKETVAPQIDLVVDPIVLLDNPEGTYTLDTSDILSLLSDNSGVISSVVMTGSGLGATTGSGLAFFANGEFIEFTCADTGSYHVDVLVTDCDSNMVMESTILTVDGNGACSPSSMAEVTVVTDPVVLLDGNGMYTLDTSDILAALSDDEDCITSIVMTGSGLGATTGSGLPFFSNGTFVEFTCADTGMYHVDIVVTDCDENITLESTVLTVDDDGACNVLPPGISGSIMHTFSEQAIQGVAVRLTDSDQTFENVTNEHGLFTFPELVYSESMSLRVEHDDDWTAGVTAKDLRMAMDYIKGEISFEPWQLASADMDHSGHVTTHDLLLIQQLILGYSNQFTEKEEMPWMFRSDQVATYTSHLETVINNAFIALSATKMGDVDGDVMAKGKTRSTERLYYSTTLLDPYTSKVSVRLNDIDALYALQLPLQWDANDLYMTDSSIELVKTGDQEGVLLYYGKEQISKELIEFTMHHKRAGMNELSLSNNISAVIYEKNGKEKSILLEREVENTKGFTYDVRIAPNPVNTHSVLTIRTNPSKSYKSFELSIYDVQGKEIFIDRKEGAEIDGILTQKLPEMPYSGVFFVHVRLDQDIQTLRIVKK